jgi:hypothetical protein
LISSLLLEIQVTTALSTLPQKSGAGSQLSDGLTLIATSVFAGTTTGDRLDVPNVLVVVTTNSAVQVDEDLLLSVLQLRNNAIEVRRFFGPLES